MVVWISLACLGVAIGALYGFAQLMRKKPTQAQIKEMTPDQPRADAVRLTCTCDEWRQARMRFRQGDPRRLCTHLCALLGAAAIRIPPSLQPFGPIIARMYDEGKGIPHATPTFAFVLGDTGYVITMFPHLRPWATVFVGRGDYTFNISTGQWGNSGRPPFASDIGSLIQAEIRRRTGGATTQTTPAPGAPSDS